MIFYNSIKSSKSLRIIYSMIIVMGFFITVFNLLGIKFYSNQTASSPYTLFIGSTFFTPSKDHFVLAYPQTDLIIKHLKDVPFIKKIKGVPGDQIDVKNTAVFLNHLFVGDAKSLNLTTIKLSPIQKTQIPNDYYFLGSDCIENGFDSRYEEFGLIHKNQIMSRLWPIY